MSLILIPTCFSALRLSRYFTYLISPHSPSSPRLLSPPHLASSLLFSSFLANQLLSTFNSMTIPHIVLAKNRKMRLKLPPVTKPTPRYHPTLQMASEEGCPPPSRALLSVRSKPYGNSVPYFFILGVSGLLSDVARAKSPGVFFLGVVQLTIFNSAYYSAAQKITPGQHRLRVLSGQHFFPRGNHLIYHNPCRGERMPHFRAVSSVPTFGWARGGAPGPVEQVPRASDGYYKANVRVCERQPRFSNVCIM